MVDVQKLVAQMADKDSETARSGKRTLWDAVRKSGTPENKGEMPKLAAELLKLVNSDQSAAVKREVIWMLSEIGGNEIIDPVAALLSNAELRDDARMVLQRLPGEKSIAAIKAALTTAPEDFKMNLIHALRARGVKVDGPPCQKLKPSRQTKVKPVGRA